MSVPNAFDVWGLGQCAFDRFARVASHPGADEKREFTDGGEQCGGPVATALFALSRWGHRAAFAGVVGDDRAGGRIRADLDRAGVDTARLLVRPGARSQNALVAVDGEGRRMILWERCTGPPPAREEIDEPAARLFLTDGLYAEPSLAFARTAPLTVVDAGTLREGTEALLDVAQVFVASESFARAFAGADDPAGACRRMRERGVAIAGVTLGARGYVASFERTLLERPAYPVRAVDTTGCGDVFHGGLAHGLLAGWAPPRCFDFAAWAAAQAATAFGARAALPDASDFPAGYP